MASASELAKAIAGTNTVRFCHTIPVTWMPKLLGSSLVVTLVPAEFVNELLAAVLPMEPISHLQVASLAEDANADLGTSLQSSSAFNPPPADCTDLLILVSIDRQSEGIQYHFVWDGTEALNDAEYTCLSTK